MTVCAAASYLPPSSSHRRIQREGVEPDNCPSTGILHPRRPSLHALILFTTLSLNIFRQPSNLLDSPHRRHHPGKSPHPLQRHDLLLTFAALQKLGLGPRGSLSILQHHKLAGPCTRDITTSSISHTVHPATPSSPTPSSRHLRLSIKL